MDTVHLDVKWDGMDTLVMRRVVMDVYLVHVPKKMDPAVVNRTGQEINVTNAMQHITDQIVLLNAVQIV